MIKIIKIILLMTYFMVTSIFYAQTTYFSEGFEKEAAWLSTWHGEIPVQSTTGQYDDDWRPTVSRKNSGVQSIYFKFHGGNNDNWVITPPIDLSSATAPRLIYYENLDYSERAGVSEVKYSTDYDGTNFSTSTWTDINTTIGTDAEDTWVKRGPYAIPVNSNTPTSAATVYIAFRYEGTDAHSWYIDDVLVREKLVLTNEEFELSKFKYSPNPVNGNLYLEAQGNIEKVSIYNMLGQEILHTAPNKTSVKVDMSALQTGVYFAKITIDGITKTKQVIKN